MHSHGNSHRLRVAEQCPSVAVERTHRQEKKKKWKAYFIHWFGQRSRDADGRVAPRSRNEAFSAGFSDAEQERNAEPAREMLAARRKRWKWKKERFGSGKGVFRPRWTTLSAATEARSELSIRRSSGPRPRLLSWRGKSWKTSPGTPFSQKSRFSSRFLRAPFHRSIYVS